MDAFLIKSPPSKKIKLDSSSIISGEVGNWEIVNNAENLPTVMHKLNIRDTSLYTSVIGFDLDGTLIQTKSGAKFPRNKNDWKLFSSNVTEKLQELREANTYVVIISNQNGVGAGYETVANFQEKIDGILSALGGPVDFICSFEKDLYRKPRSGCWDYVMNRQCPHILSSEQYPQNCTYVGDAAGRPKSGTRSKDHSAGDLKFALNLNINFLTPEQFFLNSKQRIDCDRALCDLGLQFSQLPINDPPPSELFTELSGSPEIVLLIGPAASGKSTLAKTRFTSHTRINQDELKTRPKCIKAAEELLTQGISVVVDNTNTTVAVRAEWIRLSRSLNIPVRGVVCLPCK